MRKHNKIFIQEALERRILHGLAAEWEHSLYLLDPSCRKLMQKPLFSIRNLKSKLGYWSGKKNEICLSRNLVLNHSWYAVREVLLHETAHQFAEKVLNPRDESPHGPTFQKACYLLRANPRASGNYRPLNERILHGGLSTESKIMSRVQKLMALAESRNPHEAEAAMAKAHALIEKHNIDILASDKKREFRSIFIGKPALRHTLDEYSLASLLQDFYFVQGLWASAYVMEKGKMGRVLEITGTPQNIKTADYIHVFVTNFIHFQWREYNQTKGLNRYRKTDFAVGIIKGFRSKLESRQITKKNGKNKFAIVKLKDSLLEKYMKYRYPHTTRFSRKILNQDENVIHDGVTLGQKLVISEGIPRKRTNNGLLIGHQKD